MFGLIQLASQLLRDKRGVNIHSIGSFVVEQALTSVLKKRDLTTEQYGQLLTHSGEELERLHQMILISESWLLREMQPIDAFLQKHKACASELTVLSAPCARGEEPISVLHAALMHGFELNNIRIHGYDASQRAIQQAQAFKLTPYSFRGVTKELALTMFSASESAFELKDLYRVPLKFFQADLLSETWETTLQSFDLILCRNLLIYLNPNAQTQLVARLVDRLAPGGALIVGAAEGAVVQDDRLSVSNFSPVAFAKKHRQNIPRMKPTPVKRKPVKTRQASISLPRTERSDCELLRKAHFLADRGDGTTAYALALELLEQNPANPDLHVLLGTLAVSCDQHQQARTWFENALRLDPNHEDAKLYFECLQSSGGEL